MANTYTLIASNTVGSGGASSVTFSSIASTYTDLLVKVSSRTDRNTGTTADTYVSFNGTTTNYSDRYLFGSGSAASSGSDTSTGIYDLVTSQATNTANTFGNAEVYIPNYAGSTNKSVSMDAVQENNATGSGSTLSAGLWSNTAAITSITLTPSSGNWVQYSTFYLYGIKNS